MVQFIYSKGDYTHNYSTLAGMGNYPKAGVALSQQRFCTERDILEKEHFLSKLFSSIQNILSTCMVRQIVSLPQWLQDLCGRLGIKIKIITQGCPILQEQLKALNTRLPKKRSVHPFRYLHLLNIPTDFYLKCQNETPAAEFFSEKQA